MSAWLWVAIAVACCAGALAGWFAMQAAKWRSAYEDALGLWMTERLLRQIDSVQAQVNKSNVSRN